MTERVPYRLSDVRRLMQAVEKEGKRILGVEHRPDGSVRVLTDGVDLPSLPDRSGVNEWDEVLTTQ